jgi:hypothetical protein
VSDSRVQWCFSSRQNHLLKKGRWWLWQAKQSEYSGR